MKHLKILHLQLILLFLQLLYGAIKSIEEHGCMMDVGIPGIQGFLVKPVQYEFGM